MPQPLDTNQKFRMNKLLEYSDKLRTMEAEKVKMFNKNYSKTKSLSTANQAVSGVAIRTAAATGTTAVTVVGLPVSAVLATVGGILGTTSLILSGFQKTYIKSAIATRKTWLE